MTILRYSRIFGYQRTADLKRYKGRARRIDLVVLHLAAVDCFHVKGMSEHEGDAKLTAQVGEPVPGKHAYDRDSQISAVRFSDRSERLRCSLQIPVKEDRTGRIGDANIPLACLLADRSRNSICVDARRSV